MAEKKLVIKINQERRKPIKNEPQMVTEWNMARIVVAVLVLMIFVIGGIWGLTDGTDSDEPGQVEPLHNKTVPKQAARSVANVEPVTSIPVKQRALSAEPGNNNKSAVLPDETTGERAVDEKTLPNKAIIPSEVSIKIYDKRISRAVIARELTDKEPVDIITQAIKANKNKAIGVYFFTEINQMKGRVLFHQWYWNNQLVFKRKINVLNQHWRAATSKLITYAKKGEWRVMLVNRKDKVLAKVKFKVI